MFIEDVRKLKPLPLEQIPTSPHLRRTSSVGMMMATRMSSMDRKAAGWSGGRQLEGLGIGGQAERGRKSGEPAATRRRRLSGALNADDAAPRHAGTSDTSSEPEPAAARLGDRRARPTDAVRRPPNAGRRLATIGDGRAVQQKESKMVIYGEMAAAAVRGLLCCHA